MSCPAESDLVRMVSGELAPDHRQTVLRHLEQCPECSRRLGELTSLWRTLGRWEVDASAHDVAGAVIRTVRITHATPPRDYRWTRPWRWPIPLRAAASFLLAVGLGWAAGRATAPRAATEMAEAPQAASAVTFEQVAQDMGLDALGGGAVTGLAATLFQDEPPMSGQETKG
jgi:anti-sigma factor RsiW